ncbi:hypothetical protein [Evansella cellulosilytica]|uniref:Uncharacterized protein n=1 Tax=Evansella cellulosilytica (strain ATCC 21833 / DSM 2522 / FERM P-1141 / JCM 9156 / N-4) TaxID=649639 RepID=E6U0C4_EVAC2|nr:hypothetical protein [Evansella cellulosilytica]ADU30240.1 hypothetical protein Bcell_1978 [Evansella cellulosilytica DSM 2522]
MSFYYFLCAFFILIQIHSAMFIHMFWQRYNWLKYTFSLLILSVGIIVLIFQMITGWHSSFIISSGVIMIITTLITIPVITLLCNHS